ncbi:MAG: 30S ribosomal protein S12 methylthiotransferase RimO [Bacteroidota bacterium]|nr:30S ribosomal protein S12 methylthiotransferase RimO [Bacteroidota bacterium]
MKTLQVITLGCSKNTVDTEHLLYQIRNAYEIVPEGEERERVDVLLINTCGFIGDAKEESIHTILTAVAARQEGRYGRILVFGCLSERYGRELPELIPEVDGWFGARDLAPVVRALGVNPTEEPRRVLTRPGLPYAFLKISEGCDRHCSYCAIPLIRGRHRSVPMETLVEEAKALAAAGVRELVIIAQDTTFYGLDLYKKRALAEFLRRLSAVDGIEWLRIHYSYPADFPEDVLEEMANNPKVCRYMDIPLQHIADRVLSDMRRGADGAWTRDLIRRMREKVPGVALRTTLIVGHPGESPKAFQELLDFVREARFERMGAFTYSEEEGTWGAQHLEDKISPRTKKSRLDKLMLLQQEISRECNAARVGTQERVLVDAFTDGVLVCRSEFESPEVDGEILVRYDAGALGGMDPQSLVGKFLRVRIVAADAYDLTADPIGLDE